MENIKTSVPTPLQPIFIMWKCGTNRQMFLFIREMPAVLIFIGILSLMVYSIKKIYINEEAKQNSPCSPFCHIAPFRAVDQDWWGPFIIMVLDEGANHYWKSTVSYHTFIPSVTSLSELSSWNCSSPPQQPSTSKNKFFFLAQRPMSPHSGPHLTSCSIFFQLHQTLPSRASSKPCALLTLPNGTRSSHGSRFRWWTIQAKEWETKQICPWILWYLLSGLIKSPQLLQAAQHRGWKCQKAQPSIQLAQVSKLFL